jgi:biotin synthase-like enzyme
MLKEQEDYYLNEDGNFVFTENYHLKRGFCCKNVCKHCPWSYKKKNRSKKSQAKEDLI